MIRKKNAGDEALRELKKLLVEDVHKTASPGERKRQIWTGIGIRFAVYAGLVGICYLLRIFTTLKLAVLILLFFVALEAFRYWGLGRKIADYLRKR